jgi:hypothetical protein
MIWSGAMMLEHLGEKQARRSIVGAIERTLGERTLRHAGSRRQRGYDRVRQGGRGHGGLRNLPSPLGEGGAKRRMRGLFPRTHASHLTGPASGAARRRPKIT